MELYIVDVGNIKNGISEEKYMVGEQLVLNRDLIRGFTTNRIMMIQYFNFIQEIIGEYVDIISRSCEIPDESTDYEITKAAINFHNKLSDDGIVYYASSCPEIISYRLDNDMGEVYANTIMVEASTATWEYEIIWEYIFVIFDGVFKYVPALFNDARFINLKQFILDGILPRFEDFYGQTDGKYCFDVYSILKFYMIKKIFLGMGGL